jgi:Pyruvate/2-oxoacid:ferredoxin oxidoreductase delta subunit
MSEIRKVTIFYFSGTGNAKQIALWFSEFAIKKGINCKLLNIEKTEVFEAFEPETLVMLISPIHGFNFPKITLSFINRLPRGQNNVVLMNTRAGMKIGRWVTPGLTGVAFLLSSLILKRKGYRIVGQIPFDMPSNWISIHPALNANTVKYLHQKNYARVRKHSDKVFSGKPDFLAYRDLVQDILISHVSLGYFLFGRYAFAKSFYATSACDNCGLCEKKCPVKAIDTVQGRPFWTFKCESCMKCMNSCPKKAIETAHGLFVGVSFLCSSLMTAIANDISKINLESGFLRLMVSTIIFLVLLWIFYQVQHLLLRSRLIGKIIAMTSLTYYKFWGRYKSIPDEKWK